MKMVHVTSEAKARPTITACTTMSADLNIDHGENSRIVTDTVFGAAGVALASAAAGIGAD